MTCIHDLAERETACADGLCPLCLQAENAALREQLQKAEAITIKALELKRDADALRQAAIAYRKACPPLGDPHSVAGARECLAASIFDAALLAGKKP